MKYMGSKAKYAKDLLTIMLPCIESGMHWVEPFVGGANILDKVPKSIPRFGSDLNFYLIALWKAVSRGWQPPLEISEATYMKVKEAPFAYEPALVGYCAFALSYGGKYFGGWCRDGQGVRNYVQEAYKNALLQFPTLLGVSFSHGSYEKIQPTAPSLIYCDIPYKGTTQYNLVEFDHEAFYLQCRKWGEEGHTIFVSEYEMPEDFQQMWSKEVSSSLTKDTGSKKAVEKLFKLL